MSNECKKCGENIIDCMCYNRSVLEECSLNTILKLSKDHPNSQTNLMILLTKIVKEIEKKEIAIQHLQSRICDLEILQ